MHLLEELRRRREEILQTAARHGAYNVRVFGSVATGEAGEDSDIDFLVKFEALRSLIDQALLKQELEHLLGRRVDVVSEEGLYWLSRRGMLQETVTL